ncbi:MAG: argininosuccinate lyase [Lysobacterales bacterium]
MSNLIWKKTGQASMPDEAIMTFLAGEDVLLDRELLPFDLEASAAHANGLAGAGILEPGEAMRLAECLARYSTEIQQGERVLGAEFEDGHSAIEAWLTEDLGELGKKIHTGRSRNDQVAVALRLYMRDRLSRLAAACLDIATVLLERAEREQALPMPGYTHLQRAMPSSAGMWLAGHAECFIDNAELARLTWQWADACPLGTASGFGVNLDLPRQQVSDALGFARMVVNPQCAQNSRGKIEVQAVGALAAATLDLRRLAWDLSMFTMPEFGFVVLPERFCTGSSIMPNKRNPDTVELMRAVHGRVQGAQAELQSVLSLPSGYHRDLQATKPPLLGAFGAALPALGLLSGLLAEFKWNQPAMRAALSPDVFATDRATELAAAGMPFRDAYRQVALELAAAPPGDADKSIEERVSPGAPGRLELGLLKSRVSALQSAESSN